MAFKNSDAQENTNATAAGGARRKVEILGYLNFGLPTKVPGKQRRIESIRLQKGNPIHEQVFAHLNLSKEGDDLTGMTEDQVIALQKERMARLVEMLVVGFNPSPDEAETELDL